MESYYNLTLIKKSSHKFFKFYINRINPENSSDFFSPIFNIPRLPLIGLKINSSNDKTSSHILGQILGVINFQINICQGEDKNEIEQDFNDFILPPNIDDYLNIDEIIEIDNNTDEPENVLFFMPKKKLNFYLIFSALPEITEIENKNEIKNEINFDKKNSIEENDIEENENKINININDIHEGEKNNKFDDDYFNNTQLEKDFKLFNIIPHFFYINENEQSLLDIKNLNFQKQITLFNINDNELSDIQIDSNKNKDFIDINNLRAESSNIILNENNKFIIKDNLKFYLNIKNDISQFYLLYTFHENEYHSVFYYITSNNEKAKNKMEKILNDSQNIKELINKIENNFENKQVISNLKNIFKKWN